VVAALKEWRSNTLLCLEGTSAVLNEDGMGEPVIAMGLFRI